MLSFAAADEGSEIYELTSIVGTENDIVSCNPITKKKKERKKGRKRRKDSRLCEYICA
jgi:hypothetical protein